MKVVLIVVFTCLGFSAMAQNEDLPYYQIEEESSSYNAGTMIARMIDGLGFRYFWATEGLTISDLEYKPSAEARNSIETIDHILNLSNTILFTAKNKSVEGINLSELSFDEKRALTLQNLKAASNLFEANTNVSQNEIIFGSGENIRKFSIWNIINGPISDAIWHCGQIVSFRRASGNPMSSNISLLTGKVRS
ncbi:MAG: hypothetical protein BM564_05220 [Bacteroidetes bacterium MedPE-SWsnd-G2]|nr:MAG: hypothetical protein BM564_05220 [Bacteroidetes bacterium MedPE-SWsnd-G2]